MRSTWRCLFIPSHQIEPKGRTLGRRRSDCPKTQVRHWDRCPTPSAVHSAADTLRSGTRSPPTLVWALGWLWPGGGNHTTLLPIDKEVGIPNPRSIQRLLNLVSIHLAGRFGGQQPSNAVRQGQDPVQDNIARWAMEQLLQLNIQIESDRSWHHTAFLFKLDLYARSWPHCHKTYITSINTANRYVHKI